MAHMSSVEKCQIKMKKVRKEKRKKKYEWAIMTDEERAELEFKRNKPDTIAQQLQKLIWDYDHKQLARMKFHYVLELIEQRLKELETQKEFYIGEKNKLEVVKNDMSNVQESCY